MLIGSKAAIVHFPNFWRKSNDVDLMIEKDYGKIPGIETVLCPPIFEWYGNAPSVLCQLTRSNEACRKYAFKLSSYKSDVETGLQEMLLKEVLDVARSTVNSANGDSVMFNQTKFSELAQDALFVVLKDKYGIELMQFSMSIEPPRNLQDAINDRLLAEQETKKTLASVANEEALVKLQTVKAERAKIEQAQLTPAMLRKMELETMSNIYDKLSKSPNKVIIVGDPSKIILNN